jgi:hypothetical protein
MAHHSLKEYREDVEKRMEQVLNAWEANSILKAGIMLYKLF